jgi:aldehyde dehydrogenase
MPLATSKRIAKIAFTGSTSTGRVIAQAAANNLIPATLELGGKSPNIFFADVMDKDDAFLDKAVEGLVLFAFNQGEVCTCPSRALIHESIYDRFMERVLQRVAAIRHANPLDTDSMMGAQASKEQLTKILSYLDLASRRAPRCWPAVARPTWAATWKAATTCSPRCSRATTRCASSRRKSSAPCWP